MSLKERLAFDAAAGTVHDGPRRYLLMRPDVLMGLFRRLAPADRAAALQAFAGSIAEHGSDSLRAYLAQLGGDREALIAATAAAAADLGWGRWRIEQDGADLVLEVQGSPFAEGHGPAAEPVCAPIRGMFGALASLARTQPMQADETACAAQGAACCRFVARPGPGSPSTTDRRQTPAGDAR